MTAERGWRVSPYPNGHRFAFTLVHDADSAYSRRLAPLFDAFDALQLKITATAFMFWADWARGGAIWSEWRRAGAWTAPIAVPLEDPAEGEFYRELAARGHEVGLHTPSETSSSRADVARAFDRFARLFGSAPRVYVEHSARNKRDAQVNEGSRRGSPYYNTDLLNASGAWIWVDHPAALTQRRPRFYDVLDETGRPFDAHAERAFGIRRAFVRSGRGRQADGDGFLDWYGDAHTRDLADAGGTALVYTHLDSAWLDPHTRQLRAALHERLAAIVALNPWRAPAAAILDRFAALASLTLCERDEALVLHHAAAETLRGLTLIAPSTGALLQRDGRQLVAGADGRVVIGDVAPHTDVALSKGRATARMGGTPAPGC